MNITVTINNDKVITELIHSISITSDIQSLFIEGKIVINDISSILYNDVKTGMSVVISLFDDNKSYTINTRITRFNKIPGEKNILRNIIEIYVISEWFFNSTPLTTCHTNNVSGIINNIIRYLYKNSFNKFYIEPSEDSSRVRYQLYESTLSFMNRILKYGRIHNLPVYLYPNFKNELLFKGIYNMVSNTPECALVAPECSKIYDLNGIDNNYSIIYMNAYRIISDVQNTNSRVSTLRSNDLYVPSSSKMYRSVISFVSIQTADSEIISTDPFSEKEKIPEETGETFSYRSKSSSLLIKAFSGFEKEITACSEEEDFASRLIKVSKPGPISKRSEESRSWTMSTDLPSFEHDIAVPCSRADIFISETPEKAMKSIIIPQRRTKTHITAECFIYEKLFE